MLRTEDFESWNLYYANLTITLLALVLVQNSVKRLETESHANQKTKTLEKRLIFTIFDRPSA